MGKFFETYFIQHAFGIRYILFIALSCLSITYISFDKRMTWNKPYHSFQKNRIAYHSLLLFLLDSVLTFGGCILLFSLWMMLFLKYSISTYYLNSIVFFILGLVHVLLYRNSSWTGKIAEELTLYVSINVLYTLCSLISTSLTQTIDGSIYDFLVSFFYFFFLLGVVILLKLQSAKKFPSGELLPFLFLELSTILSLISTLVINPSLAATDQSRLKYLVIFIGIEVLILLLYTLYYRTLYEKKKAYEKEALVYKKQTEKRMAQLSRENFTQLIELQEEIKKQYIIIDDILNENDPQKLKTYFADVFETSIVPLTFIDCGNTTISAILNIELFKARRKGIEIEESILVPKDFGFLDYDLCSFFTNIIDNAIEATEIASDRKIKVEIEYKKPYLITVVKNPTALKESEIEEAIQTTHKNKKEMHGFGNKIIKSITEKYNGTIIHTINDGTFTLKAMLMEPSEKEIS